MATSTENQDWQHRQPFAPEPDFTNFDHHNICAMQAKSAQVMVFLNAKNPK
jgi:hypothetical protein